MSETKEIEQRDFAIQQLTGFDHAARGYHVESLIENMGLTAAEWESVKPDVLWLKDSIFDDIEAYFEKQAALPRGDGG